VPGFTGQSKCPVYREPGKPNPGTRYNTLINTVVTPGLYKIKAPKQTKTKEKKQQRAKFNYQEREE
jgi:hypothetical protein